MTGHLNKARAAWAAGLPDWVEVLAARCDTVGQATTARQIGYSASAVSCVIGRTYGGATGAVEQAVRATLMAATVACPELGELALARCREWADRSTDFQPTSSQRRVMFHACRACPTNHRQQGGRRGQ
jgi:hypothetical protein